MLCMSASGRVRMYIIYMYVHMAKEVRIQITRLNHYCDSEYWTIIGDVLWSIAVSRIRRICLYLTEKIRDFCLRRSSNAQHLQLQHDYFNSRFFIFPQVGKSQPSFCTKRSSMKRCSLLSHIASIIE